MEKTAISPTRSDNYPEWYQEIIKQADLAENSVVRGCMVIKPWGYGIWERMQKALDLMIKDTGHENAYFPLFIPLSFLEKESAHVEGFAKECAVVTHHRLESRNGKLIPVGELEEPLVVRPTSETIIGDSFAKWIQSYRDLPMLINQWANIVRWEMRPRIFLRTSEFLWQEGHTVHESEEEALEETIKMLHVYRDFVEEHLAVPLIVGEKPAFERFPGAEKTFCIEAIMQDGKALQAGTSHYLGQNFAKAFGIKFLNRSGVLEHGYTTSWGASTRLMGALIMSHADDNGMRVPPRVAPKQVVVIPVTPKEETKDAVISYAEKVAAVLKGELFFDEKITTHVDKRDIRGGDKSWSWIKKGVPIRVEVGPRDLESNAVVVYRRDEEPKTKVVLNFDELRTKIPSFLAEIQNNYFKQAKQNLNKKLNKEIQNYNDFKAFFTGTGDEKQDYDKSGYVLAKWSGSPKTEEMLAELKVTVRCIPTEQSGTTGKCVLTGEEATIEAVFAKAY